MGIVGPASFTARTQVCLARALSREYPTICSNPQTKALAEGMEAAPSAPGAPVLLKVTKRIEGNLVEFISAAWRPPIFWGRHALSMNRTRGIEVEIAELKNGTDTSSLSCGMRDISALVGNNDAYANSISKCKATRLLVPLGLARRIIKLEEKNCRFGTDKHNLILPLCMCGAERCNAAAANRDLMSTMQIFLGDLYASKWYALRIRATVHEYHVEREAENEVMPATSESESILSSNTGDKTEGTPESVLYAKKPKVSTGYGLLLETRPLFNSNWSTWSAPIQRGSPSLPSRPPQPDALEAGYTSVQFRIYRAAFHGSPITHYIFQMAPDTACGDLSNLRWDKIEEVIVPVNDTHSPYIDFLRGDPSKGGIGAALDEPGLYHFRVAAVNSEGVSNTSDYQTARNPVQLGTLSFPAFIYPHADPGEVNLTSCEDIKAAIPRCPNILLVRQVFFEIVDMRIALQPNNVYNFSDISFGREGVSIFANGTDNPRDTVVDCNGTRCFKFCERPYYIRGAKDRCFPPTSLAMLTFRNGRVKNGDGGVMMLVPAVLVLQRRSTHIKDCIFTDNHVVGGNGGAIAAKSKLERAAIFITRSTFYGNTVSGGAGGAIMLDSSEMTFTDVQVYENDAHFLAGMIEGTNTSITNPTSIATINAVNATNATNANATNTTVTARPRCRPIVLPFEPLHVNSSNGTNDSNSTQGPANASITTATTKRRRN